MNKTKDTQGQKKATSKKRWSLKTNQWIVKNIPFYFFLAAITVLYIANGHYADKLVRKINATDKNLKELEYEFKTVKRDVIFRSKQSELAKAVEPLGLKPLVIPPVLIIDSIQNKQ